MSKSKKRIEAAKERAVRQRNYRRVRDRALARLGREYPDVYRAFFEEEMKSDESMDKKWLDLSGRTRSTASGSR